MTIEFILFDARIQLGFGFFLIPALVLCYESGGYFLPIMLAYAVHELGHIIAARICGMQITEIRFGALGIQMKGNMQALPRLRRAAISLSGPLTNFLFFLLLLPFGPVWYGAEILLFIFHILPAVPLDGGMALYSVLCTAMHERTAARCCTAASVVLAFMLGVLGFSVLLRTKGNFTILLTACYILFYVLKKHREDLC